jgi:hypothetical protein
MSDVEYGYEPTDLEDELFLSEVPVELLQESIESQFKDPLEYRKKDYVQTFITKYEFSKENMLEDDANMLEITRDKFLLFLETIFNEYLSVGFNDYEDMDVEDQNELFHHTYRFFLKNIKKNFVNIVINWIEESKDHILSNYEKKKDITFLNFKAELDNDFDVIVLSNLGNIINEIITYLRSMNDVDEFFRLCESDEAQLELECVKHYYDEMTLTGNFIENYVDMIDGDFQSEIQSKVRNRILKKYPKRERRNIEEDINDSEDEITDETEE